MLEKIIPFRYLSRRHRVELEALMGLEIRQPDEVVIHQGDSQDKRIFILEKGLVETIDRRSSPPASRGLIEENHYFGERAALFDESRRYEVRAVRESRIWSFSAEAFLQLLRHSPPFAQAFGNILRDKQGVFVDFDRLWAEFLRGVARERMDMERLVPLYQALEPALHPFCTAQDRIDLNALAYAVRRLPQNLTRTFAWYVADALPALYSLPDRMFHAVLTAARRRSVYEMLPGKNMVLARDGLSDLADLVTCLCLYAVEARKIRRRLGQANDFALDPEGTETLPFSQQEMEVFQRLWPNGHRRRLLDVALHHEDFQIEVKKQLNNYNSAHSESWSAQIAEATRRLTGVDPGDLPPDTPVHVVSSNTHSVHNCLSCWLTAKADQVREWARSADHPLASERWTQPQDLVYAVSRDYFEANPDQARERSEDDRERGVLWLTETAFTGIQVQIIDLSKLCRAPIDPAIEQPNANRGLIVNIDYAFGEQARHIMACLTALFGANLASLTILGKAGALQGKRGDILVATGFLEQDQDAFYPLPDGNAADLDLLKKLAPNRGIHVGPTLTVAGTLLQNRRMLHFNRSIWGCVGLEMEGSHYFRQILKSMQRSILPARIPLRFLYYVSDLPLDHDANLSGRLRAMEGVPPLYAVTREALTAILRDSS